MNPRSFLPLLFLLALLLITAGTSGASQAASPGGQFVRIAAADAPAALALGLNPARAVDYGSFHWLELDEAGLSRLARSGVPYVAATDAGTVHVPGYRFDPLRDGEPALDPALRAGGAGEGFYLVQLAGPTSDAWLAALEARGLRLLQYYPHHAFLVWADGARVAAAGDLDFVRWTGAYHPAYKLDGGLAGRAGTLANVDVFFYNDGDVLGTLAALRRAGAVVLQSYAAQPDQVFYDAIVRLPATALDAVAALPTVLWLGHVGPEPILDDEMSSQILAGNYNAGVPFPGYYDWINDTGYDGTGVTWGIIDTGVDYDHPDLGPNIVSGYSFPGACDPPGQPGSDCAGGGHGTHVAGIVGGTAAGGFSDTGGFLYGLGVAPGYSIFTSNSLSAPSWPPVGGWQEHSKRAVLGGAIGGNNSWTSGEGTQHGYQATERTHDIMVRDGNFDTTTVAEPFIEVFSAGNSGFSGLTSPKEGKNLIVVASSVNYRVGNIDAISGFSSRGPAVDGRWVPTVAAPGEQIASARNDLGGSCSSAIPGTNNLYAFCSGTSMAAPHAAGAITIATEWWRSFNGGADPSPAMAKALLVNSAVDMAAADIPNIHEGWGRVNIDNLLNAETDGLYWDQETTFDGTGEQWILSLGVPDTSRPLKITLAWSDAPGAVGANPALVNNLDLTVINGGSTYLGNVFSGGWSMMGGAADTINNLENVYVQNPAAGVTIIVDAVNISGDGVPYSGDATDQDFALICQNCALFPDFTLDVSPDAATVCVPDDAFFTVDVGNILGFDDPVTLSAPNTPPGVAALFDVNPVIPPGSSQLTLDTMVGLAPGVYAIDVVGIAPTSTHTTTVGLSAYTAVPGLAPLQTPANGATGVSLTPTFTWTPAAQAASYLLRVATDPAFANVIYSASEAGTSHTMDVPLNPLTTYYWTVRAQNACGDGSDAAAFSFTTLDVPPVLLVDDDDNNPNVRPTYTAALDALGVPYDVWDTANSDNEPDSATLLQYDAIVWFSGDEFGGAAGPGAAGEAALATYLDAGGCFFISAQDYRYDRGLTAFMQNYLGAQSVTNDAGDYTSVTGQGSLYGGFGPSPLTYPFTDYSDIIAPNATAESAWIGINGRIGAVNRVDGVKSTFWTFPWEALPQADREATLAATLAWCEPPGPGLVATINYAFAMNNGGSGSGTYTLYDDATFADSTGGGGLWAFRAGPPPRLLLWHQGVQCDALSIGFFPGGGLVRGFRVCTDGSGARGLWQGTILPAQAGVFPE